MKFLQLLIICLVCEKSAAQWEVVTNAPQKFRFDDVTFIANGHGWIAQDFELYKTTDGGLNWNLVTALPPNTSNYIRSLEFISDSIGFYSTLATSQQPGALLRTSDGGFTWTQIPNIPVNQLDGICSMTHFSNLVLAAGTYSSTIPYVYKSLDKGLSWTAIDLSSIGSGIVDIHAFDNYNYVIAGIDHNNRAFIARTNDGGATWQTRVTCNRAGVSYIWKLFFLPNGVGFASVEGHSLIYKTHDYGNHWDEIEITAGVANDLGAIGALNDTVIWVGRQFDYGMFGTTDGGLNWTAYPNFGHNMDRMVMTDNNHLICAGSTIYRFTGDNNDVVPDSGLFRSKHHHVSIKPNPVNNLLKIKLEIFQSTTVRLELTDISGRTVIDLYKGVLDAGEHNKEYFLDKLASGTYILWFRSNEEHKMLKLIRR